ncbi:hypothetical protein EJD96_22035 [Herbaspirillum seropedicae]|uniref:hypothetical protein n=1 Tax=Herbaspirillum seropedicae TaxID=964 RepID=UPI00111E82F1|nr:hypothetical protein [Herbaspirillum seropedicae]QDD66652.1 hypothetical protein EJD96_22035 [Herbaspirillum seropedicae]
MKKDAINAELKELAFNFFWSFSRFEFALKENHFAKPYRHEVAQPDWDTFIDSAESTYRMNAEAYELLAAPPDVQTLEGTQLSWRPLNLARVESDLGKVVLVIKTIRNNLFHGGKHDAAGWDDPARVHFLLSKATKVLEELAESHFNNDFIRIY